MTPRELDETEPSGIIDFCGRIIRAFSKINDLVYKSDPKYHKLAWRKGIWNGARRVLQVVFGSFLIQKILEWFAEYPEFLPYVIGSFLIGGNILQLISRIKDDSFDRQEEEFEHLFEQKLHDQLQDKSLSLDLGRISETETKALEREARSGTHGIPFLWKELGRSVYQVVVLIGSGCAVLFLDPLLAALIVIPLFCAEQWRLIKVTGNNKSYEKADADKIRLIREYNWCLSDLDMMFQARLFGLIPYIKGKRAELRDYLNNRLAELERKNMRLGWFVNTIHTLCFTIATIVVVRRCLEGNISPGEIFFLTGELGVLAGAIYGAMHCVNRARKWLEDYEGFEEYLLLEPLINETQCFPAELKSPPTLRFDGVSYVYKGKDAPTLHQLTFEIGPSEKVFIVGANGSGKTTTSNVLAKLIPPKEGSVLVNGTSLSRITQESWYQHLTYVTWGNKVPDFPIDEVVAGVRREDLDFDRMIRAAQITGVYEFVKDLPSRFETPIGDTLPGGQDFSTGQLQRIKIAAGLYRILGPTVQIGLFDEPMANCDPQVRAKFYPALAAIENKTIIVVAHDPDYLHHFDRVIVIDAGGVKEDIRGRESIEAYQTKCRMEAKKAEQPN